MPRLILSAALCLAGIAGLFAVRTVVGANAVTAVPPKVITADTVDSATPPLSKSDRLPSRFFDTPLPKTSVETVKILPTEIPKQPTEPPKLSEASKDDVVSWHWHEGSKVIRRSRTQ